MRNSILQIVNVCTSMCQMFYVFSSSSSSPSRFSLSLSFSYVDCRVMLLSVVHSACSVHSINENEWKRQQNGQERRRKKLKKIERNLFSYFYFLLHHHGTVVIIRRSGVCWAVCVCAIDSMCESLRKKYNKTMCTRSFCLFLEFFVCVSSC